jgi:DNA-binding winged helix-turn-helix (wHTH) protein
MPSSTLAAASITPESSPARPGGLDLAAYVTPGPEQIGPEGMLLAVIPIPGTDSSLAVVGYEVPAAPARDGGRTPRQPAGGIVVDHARRRVWLEGQEVALTFQEFELLAFLSANPGQVFSRGDLLDRVWHADAPPDTRTVDVHVSRLRRKLGPVYGQCLTTEYRVGYRFDPSAGADGPEGPQSRPGRPGRRFPRSTARR